MSSSTSKKQQTPEVTPRLTIRAHKEVLYACPADDASSHVQATAHSDYGIWRAVHRLATTGEMKGVRQQYTP